MVYNKVSNEQSAILHMGKIAIDKKSYLKAHHNRKLFFDK